MPRPTASQQIYFDLGELCQKLPHKLAGSSVSKTVVYQGKTTQFNLATTDTSYWQAELQLLSSCNINKTAFWGQYEVIRTDTSELYTAQNPSFKIRSLLIVKSLAGELQRIEVVFRQNTSFFDLSRIMQFYFQNGLLASYQIRVFKQIAMQNSVSFQVIAHLDSYRQ